MANFGVIDLGQIYDNQDRWHQNALNGRIQQMQMQEMAKQISNRNALNEALTAGWTPEQTITTPAPGNYDTAEGGDIPAPTVTKKPGGFDMQAIQSELVKRGLGSEALNFQMQQDAANKETRKMMLEYQLKDAIRANDMKRASEIMKGFGDLSGTSLQIGPQGATVTMDPIKAAQLRIDQERLRYETGGPASPRGAPQAAPGLTPKSANEVATKRLKDLQESASGRVSSLDKAQYFHDLLASGQMQTGAGRKYASFVPGVWTQQGRLDEEFNSFAETAARAALKASGEQRPTDADVKGMKEAMFGVGRDEGVNINLLKDYITQQMNDESEYRKMTGMPEYQYTPRNQPVKPQKANKAAAGPKPGTMQDGYVFMGGNPADPNSWKSLK